MSDTNNLLERLRAFLETEEGKQSIKDFHRSFEIRDIQTERVSKYMKTLSEEELIEKFLLFLKWEEEYEEMMYKRGIQTGSHIFHCLTKVAENEGKKLQIRNDEDFVYNKFIWKGYSFLLFVGQGSFWRIKKGKKIIFQQT